MELVWNVSCVNSAHGRGGVWVSYLSHWCLCRISSFCPSRPALHFHSSSCVALESDAYGYTRGSLESGQWGAWEEARKKGGAWGRVSNSVAPSALEFWGCCIPQQRPSLLSSSSFCRTLPSGSSFLCPWGLTILTGATTPEAPHFPLAFPCTLASRWVNTPFVTQPQRLSVSCWILLDMTPSLALMQRYCHFNILLWALKIQVPWTRTRLTESQPLGVCVLNKHLWWV